jgi:pSer/pThr/pTyr-binding forkhead associated (FHA) protein
MNDDQVLPEEETEDRLLEEAAKGEGMVVTPDDLPHARLVLHRNGAETEEVFEVRGHATIGRFDAAVGPVDVDLGPLPESTYISRKHAEIRSEEGRWFLKDLGSSNGTFVMGDNDFERIDGEVPISDGAEIAFGNVRFVFHTTASEVETVTPEPDAEITEDEATSGI